MIIAPQITPRGEQSLIGKKATVFKDDFSPEAEGIIEKVRGYGSLRVIEVRVFSGQPGPRLRIAHEGQWEVSHEYS